MRKNSGTEEDEAVSPCSDVATGMKPQTSEFRGL